MNTRTLRLPLLAAAIGLTVTPAIAQEHVHPDAPAAGAQAPAMNMDGMMQMMHQMMMQRMQMMSQMAGTAAMPANAPVVVVVVPGMMMPGATNGMQMMMPGAAGMTMGGAAPQQNAAMAMPQTEYARAAAAANAKMMAAMQHTPTNDPDHDFAMMMVPHHQGAIDMAQIELQYGKDPEMRAMAKAIITAQEAEIAQLRHWMEMGAMPGMTH